MSFGAALKPPRHGQFYMNVSNEKSISLWMGTKVLDDAPVLDKTEKADVVIVGSGIAGMSVAYRHVRQRESHRPQELRRVCRTW